MTHWQNGQTEISGNGKVASSREQIRIVLADDHGIVRGALRMLLEGESDLEVVAEAGDGETAARCVLGHKPDVLVLDLNMPGISGLDAIGPARENSPETEIVVLTMLNEPAAAKQALRAGALGYVQKEAASSDLITAVRMAARGETYLQPELGAKLAAEPDEEAPDNLSGRELDVLRLIALGHTNAEIGEQLFLSVRTIESHRSHIQQKLDCHNRAGLVRYAFDRGLVETS
ncbi:MAG: response regulator [Solirubrobacterales bacterium]